MGFSVSATHIIFFIAAIVIATTVVGALHGTAGKLSGGISTKSDALYDELATDLRIVNDPGDVDTNPLVVYALNTGSKSIDPDEVVLLIDGTVHTDLTTDVLDGDSMWRSGQVLEITANGTNLGAGDHRVRVVAESGASDTLRFNT